ncbi:MAG: endolytic transglycosylase MltG [bacterium]|nr:endolytic transglycosylase MltG [bacterium]
MKKRIWYALVPIIISILLLSISLRKKDGYSSSIIVTIPGGADTKKIAQLLEDNGLIKTKCIFVIFVKFRGVEGELKAGRYRLNKGMRIGKIIDKLVKGETIPCKITIPEGFTLSKIARRLMENGLVNEERFLKLCNDKDFFKRLKFIPRNNLEGYLFPDTYEIAKGMKEEDIIRMMVDRFKKVVIEKYEAQAKKQGFSIFEITTLASIIEKEAKVDYERSIISAVYHNRLKRRLNLCACPTVLYALGEHKANLSEEDLNIDSPYNTYLYPGLPPGPICSPGEASIRAAVFPKKVDYLYFVSKGDGTHRFTFTFSQHNRAKRVINK